MFLILILFTTTILIYINFNKIYNFFNQFKSLSLKEKLSFFFKKLFLFFFYLFGLFIIYKICKNLIQKKNSITSFNFYFNNILNEQQSFQNFKKKKFKLFENFKLFFKSNNGVIFNEKSLPNLSLGNLNEFDKKLNLINYFKKNLKKKIEFEIIDRANIIFDQNQFEIESLKKKKEIIFENIIKNKKKQKFNFLSDYFNKKNFKNLNNLNNLIELKNLKLFKIKSCINKTSKKIYLNNSNLTNSNLNNNFLNVLNLFKNSKKEKIANLNLEHLLNQYSIQELNRIKINKGLLKFFTKNISLKFDLFLSFINFEQEEKELIKISKNLRHKLIIQDFLSLKEKLVPILSIYENIYLNINDDFGMIEKKRLNLIENLEEIRLKMNESLKQQRKAFLPNNVLENITKKLKNEGTNKQFQEELYLFLLDQFKNLMFLSDISYSLKQVQANLNYIDKSKNPFDIKFYYKLVVNYNRNIANFLNDETFNFSKNYIEFFETDNFLNFENSRFQKNNAKIAALPELKFLQDFVLNYHKKNKILLKKKN